MRPPSRSAFPPPRPATRFVGDTPEADVLGAQQFGMGMTALVGEKSVEGVRADVELESVASLVDSLRARDLIPAD